MSSSFNIADDREYQRRSLLRVSRTFALTIPQLPDPLAWIVGNAYLLFRVVDTIEDDRFLAPACKRKFMRKFTHLLSTPGDIDAFSRELSARLVSGASPDELDLMAHIPTVLRITAGMNPVQKSALRRCIRIMADGMSFYQEHASCDGLSDLSAMEDYCYCVGGVVGELLTDFFCDYSGEIASCREELFGLSASFGKGLQMTNILKDVWEDRKRNVCWLPRSVFCAADCDLSLLQAGQTCTGYRQGIHHLLGIALGHLRNALRYTLLIPEQERGIRRFCGWALGMAVLTLRRIYHHPDYQSNQEVKISRYSVYGMAGLTSVLIGSNRSLRFLFERAAAGLPSPERHVDNFASGHRRA